MNLPPAVQLMLKTSLRARRGSLLSAKAHHHRPCPASGHSLVAYSRQLLFSTRKDLPCSHQNCRQPEVALSCLPPAVAGHKGHTGQVVLLVSIEPLGWSEEDQLGHALKETIEGLGFRFGH